MPSFFLDANRINARCKCPGMNQLERLAKEGKCELLMPRIAWNESEKGDNEPRQEKTWSYDFVGLEHTSCQLSWFKKIEAIIFPSGAVKQNQINDVWILVTAREMKYPLVTNDGASKSQKGGMLGNREKLGEIGEIGVRVIRDTEAVRLVLNNGNT